MGADGGGALPPGVISEDFDDDSPAEAVFYYKESTSGTEDAGGSGATPAQKTSTPLELDLVRVPPPPAPSDRAGKDAAGGSVSSGTTPAADATAGTSMEAPSPTNGAKVSPLGNEEDGDASTSRDGDEPGPGDSDRERGNILDADLHEASPVTGPAVSSSSNFYEDFFYNNNELHDQEEAGGRDDPFPALQRDWYHTCKPRIHAWPPNLELPMRVFITVWNLHGKAPPRDFSTWIPHSLQNPSSMHHLYIVGTCESCQTINQAIFCRKRAKVQEFEQNFERFLNGWYKVAISSLGAIHLMAFAHKSIAQKIWDVRTLNCSTGFGNVVGNKGGVLLSLSVGASSFLFVVSHLPAHKSGYKKRTEAFERIMGHSRRYLKPANRMAPEQVTPVSSAAWQDNTDEIFESSCTARRLRGGRASRIHPVSEADLHDYVFFFGDLNFRLDISRDKADKHVALSEHARLLAADTLAPLLGRNLPPWARRSHAGDEDAEDDIPQRGDVDEQNTTRAATGSPHHLQDHLLLHHERPSWNQLTEMPIRFPPTYKIDAYTRLQYDSSKKRRVPAWTDRILFKPNANLVPLAYDAIFDQEQLFLSDHRPVFAQFAIKFADAQLRHHALGKQATAARKGTSSVCAIM
eukprot:g16026.t1